MKFYYIDETMFQNTKFAQCVLSRFVKLTKKNMGSMVFVSCKDSSNEILEDFIKMSKIPVIVSPSTFDIEGIRGNLQQTFLSVEMFPKMQSFNGSCVAYNTLTMSAERIYLDLFIGNDNSYNAVINDFEERITDRLMELMKKNQIIN
ncbi:MAG: hypothetical protein RR766_06405 [Longicatena sp.]